MQIFCTYPLSVSDRSKGKVEAIRRWGTPRVKGIDGRARSAKRGMFFVSGSFGLIPHDQPVNSDLKTFTETDIEGILPRVRNSLIKYQIDDITFYLNPAEKQGLAYLRLLVIACYLQRKTLTTRSFKDEEFPDWMESMREAKLTRERARGLRDKPDRIKESFDLLLKKYGRDPMILFEQANTYADLDNFEAAAKDYEEAARLFPLPEFENLAHQKAREAKEKIRGSSARDLGPSKLEQGISWPESDPGIKTLYTQARKLVPHCPSASVSVSRTALVRLVVIREAPTTRETDRNNKLGERIQALGVSPHVKTLMGELSTLRNKIEYDPCRRANLATPTDAKLCVDKLMEVLAALYPRR